MINLLQPELKEEYNNYLAKRFVVFFGSAMILVLLIFVVLLSASFLFLKIQNLALEEQITALENSEQNRNFQSLNKSLADLIQLYRTVAATESKLFKLLPILEELVILMPDPIYLTNLNFNFQQKEINLGGFAPRRDNVITLKDRLDRSPYFSKVVSPLSNLVKDRDILFNFTLVIKE
jgi:Tfp pilus assembly protein PilN